MAVMLPFQNVCHVPGATVEACHVLRYGERTISGAAGRIGVVRSALGIAAGRPAPGVASSGWLPCPAVGASRSAVRLRAAAALALASPPPTAAAVAPETCRKRRRSIPRAAAGASAPPVARAVADRSGGFGAPARAARSAAAVLGGAPSAACSWRFSRVIVSPFSRVMPGRLVAPIDNVVGYPRAGRF